MKNYKVVELANKFLDLLRESIITQSLITVAVLFTYLYMVIKALPVPPLLETLIGVVVGFYFGSKIGYKQGNDYMMRFVPKRESDTTKIKAIEGE